MFWVNDYANMIFAKSARHSRVESDQTLLPASYVLVAVIERWLFLGSDEVSGLRVGLKRWTEELTQSLL